MSFNVGTADDFDSMMYGDASSWQGAPDNGVDLVTEAGVQVGSAKWHARMTSDLWSVIIILGAILGLWVLGGVVFKSVTIP